MSSKKLKSEEAFFSTNPICDPSAMAKPKTQTRVNWASSAAREIAYRLRLAISAPDRDRAAELERRRAYAEQQRLAAEYSEGYLAGWHDCYAACVSAVEEEVLRKTETWWVDEMVAGSAGPSKTN